MTTARKSLIDLEQTTYYHCIARCVRRAFLCGEDHVTGKNFEHRKAWVAERLDYLAKTFAIDITSYAIMSNHYHVVLRVDVDKAKRWNDANVVRRWKRVCKVPAIVQKYLKGDATRTMATMAQDLIATWRQRLTDISWFMRLLNEHIARRANKEDDCTGRFWEGRFKSQALLDEAAVLTAMAYVDLNPIRANKAKSPERSDYTSIQQRIKQSKNKPLKKPVKLLKLAQGKHSNHKHSFQISSDDYIDLVETTGRVIRVDKPGFIPNELPAILIHMNLEANGFLSLMRKKDDISGLKAIDSPAALTHLTEHCQQTFIKGIGMCRRLYA